MPDIIVFPCPQCGEFIATDASRCRFCSTPVDPQAAALVVFEKEKEHRRYLLSGYRRHMWRGGGLCLLGLVGSVGAFVLAYYSGIGGVYFVPLGVLIAGAGDFLYGFWGVAAIREGKVSGIAQ